MGPVAAFEIGLGGALLVVLAALLYEQRRSRRLAEKILAAILESSAAEVAQRDALVLRAVGAFQGLLLQADELGRLKGSGAAEGARVRGEPEEDEDESGEREATPPSSKKH